MDFTDIVTWGVVLVASGVAIAAILAAIYIWHVWTQRREEAPFLTRLVHRDIRVAAASAVILFYTAAALSGFSFGRPWGAIVIGIPVIVMMGGPSSDAILWFRERRAWRKRVDTLMDERGITTEEAATIDKLRPR